MELVIREFQSDDDLEKLTDLVHSGQICRRERH